MHNRNARASMFASPHPQPKINSSPSVSGGNQKSSDLGIRPSKSTGFLSATDTLNHPIHRLTATRHFFVKYGDRIQLAAKSSYVADGNELAVVGEYRKSNRFMHHQGASLFVVPPLTLSFHRKRFSAGVFTIVDPDTPRLLDGLPSEEYEGKPISYGNPFMLVDGNGKTWSNRTSFQTGYVGPRRQRRRGEMFMVFSRKEDDGNEMHPIPSRARSSGTGKSSERSRTKERKVAYGDYVWIDVITSNRHRSRFNNRISNFKKRTSSLPGGYLCSDGSGTALLFNIRRYLSSGNSEIDVFGLVKRDEATNSKRKLSAASEILDGEVWRSDHSEGESNDELEDAEESMSGDASAFDELSTDKECVNGQMHVHGSTFKSSRGSVSNAQCHGYLHPTVVFICTSTFGSAAYSLLFHSVPTYAALDIFMVRLVVASIIYFLVMDYRCEMANGGVPLTSSVPPLGFYFAINNLQTGASAKKPENSSSETVNQPPEDEQKSQPRQKTPAVEKKDKSSSGAETRGIMNTASPVSALATQESDIFPLPCKESDIKGEVHDMAAYPPDGSGDVLPPMPARIVTAEGGDFDAAVDRWRSIIDWRRKNKVDDILEEPQPHFDHIKDCYPHFFHRLDKTRKYYCYYFQPGECDMRALESRGVNMDDLVRHNIFLFEFMWRVANPSAAGKLVTIIDMKGVGFWKIAQGPIKGLLMRTVKMGSTYYPERTFKTLIVNVPSWFSAVWTLVRPFLTERSVNKISILRGNYQNELGKLVDEDSIPQMFGGKCRKAPYGGSLEIAMREHVRSHLKR